MMNYTPEQQRDIARLQELGALVTDADTVKYDKEVAPEKGIWKYLAQGLDFILELLTLTEEIAFVFSLVGITALFSCHRLAIELKYWYWGALILCFATLFLSLLSKLPAVHIKKIAAYYYTYTCVITAEQLLIIKQEFDTRGLTKYPNTQTFTSKTALREENLIDTREKKGGLFTLGIWASAQVFGVLDFASAVIVMLPLYALHILLCYLNKKSGKA